MISNHNGSSLRFAITSINPLINVNYGKKIKEAKWVIEWANPFYFI